ncbi:MAG: hypothetical protein Q9219_005532 [cf. Caloplaca sp. 3 TL-2023]
MTLGIANVYTDDVVDDASASSSIEAADKPDEIDSTEGTLRPSSMKVNEIDTNINVTDHTSSSASSISSDTTSAEVGNQNSLDDTATTISLAETEPHKTEETETEETKSGDVAEIEDKDEYSGVGERDDVVRGKRTSYLLEKRVKRRWVRGVGSLTG